jgi:hypothetical protein
VAEVIDTPEFVPELAEMEQLLGASSDVRHLAPEQRQRVLAQYRKRPPSDWAQLPPAVLLALARLVSMAGLGSRALELYQLLLVHHAQCPQAGEAVVEAAALADRIGASDKVGALVQHALTLPLTAEQRNFIEQLQARQAALAVPQEEAIPTVLPVQQPAPAPVARRAGEAPVVLEAVEGPPPPPRRSLGEMMAAFMEERNILWGELVGGLLIVGCSIALVFSLREKLEELPYFPFLIVSAVTAALIGAGRYTLSHWKLESTSRGLLVIGTMMVPLSFMVLAGLATASERGTEELAAELVSIALFTWMVRGAANILVRQPVGPAAPRPDWLTTLAILGASAGMLLVPHIEARYPGDTGLLGLVGYAPAAFFVLSQAGIWQAVYRREQLAVRQAGGLFLGLALSAYALGVAFGFILYRTENIGRALEYLAVPVALAGLPLLLGGTIATAKLRASDAGAAEPESGGLSLGVAGVIASMLSLGGALVMLLALGAAWPHPWRLTAIGAVNAVVLACVAHRFRLAPAYVPAMICLTVAALTGYHALAGHFDDVGRAQLGRRLLAEWLSPTSGVVLVIVAGLVAAASEWLARGNRIIDSRYLACGGGVIVLASLLLVVGDERAAPGRAAVVFGVSAAGAWLANARWRLAWLTALAAAVFCGAAFFAMRWYDAALPMGQSVVWALLAAAGGTLLLAVVVERLVGQTEEMSASVQRSYVMPLHGAALTASILATATLLLSLKWDWLPGACTAAVGIAGIWLVLAWRTRQPLLFAAFQVALAGAMLLGTVSALQTQAWFTNDANGLLGDVRSWQAYGVGLSGLALAMTAARFGLRKNERAWALVEPGSHDLLPVDRLLLIGLVVLAIIVTVSGVAPGVVEELTPTAVTATPLHVQGPLSWCWLGLLALALALTLWQGQATGAVPGLTAVALCVPLAAAGLFAPDLAAASAVRWGLALTFVSGSALSWWRRDLARLASAGGIRWDSNAPIATTVRVLLVAGAVVPVLFLTADVAALGFARRQPAGPVLGSFFDELGVIVNNMTRLVLLCVGLAGHGVRERSAGYAFGAGQVALAAVVGGYALGIITGGGTIGAAETVQLGQLATAVTAVWLLGWLAVRRSLSQTAPANALPCAVMLALQEGLTWLSYVVWLGPALLLLAFPQWFGNFGADAAVVFKQEAGSWLAWVVVGLAMAAGIAYRLDAVAAVPSWLVAVAAMLVGGVGCCTVAIYVPDWDQRALMLTAASLALGFVLLLVRWSVHPPGQWLIPYQDSAMELALTCLVGGLAVSLGIQRAAAVNDHYWAAVAVAVVAVAAAAAALLRRGEGWMFAGNLLAMLAVSLVVCHDYPGATTTSWLVFLIQANLFTVAVVGLFWLYYLKRIGNVNDARLQANPWLCVQQGLAFCGNAALLWVGFMRVITVSVNPDDPLVLAIGRWPGWLALAPAAVGTIWLLCVLAPRHTIHGLAGIGLMSGVLAACLATHVDHGSEWLGFHVLTLSWLVVAAGILAMAWVADRQRQAPVGSPPWWTDLVPRQSSVYWVFVIGAVVVLLVFPEGWRDPYRPTWPSAMVLGASALMGALHVWTRRGGFAYASGLLFNVVGQLVWQTWAEEKAPGEDATYRWFVVHTICLALASLVWSGIEQIGRQVRRWPAVIGDGPPFRHLAVWGALGLLTLTVSYGLLADLAHAKLLPDPFVWLAIAAILAAAVATLWDQPAERWAGPLPQLYVLGLMTLLTFLDGAEIEPARLAWACATVLGPYVLLASAACVVGLRHPELGQELGMPGRPHGWPLAWFVPAQLAVSALAAGLALWYCLTSAELGFRLGSVLSVACLVPATAILAPYWTRLVAGWRPSAHRDVSVLADARFPRFAALLLGVLACACLHCAFIDPDYAPVWLHRSVLLMAAVTWMSVLYGLLLPRLLPADNSWAVPARRLAAPLGGLACGFLLLTLLQEAFLFDPALHRTPLKPFEVIVVALALCVLVAGALTLALSPKRDVLRLSERGRTLYVYAAEVLLALLFFHIRLNVEIHLTGRYWVFAIMGLAFLGVGLSELCQRRGLRVLADPLQRTAMFLPLLPVLAFLARPLAEIRAAANEAVAGAVPMTGYLERLPGDYRWHAAIWFLTGLLYLAVALSRRSSNLALVAAVLANFGLWVLFGHHDQLSFLLHPQLWLIPIGIIVLAAEHLNRDRLQPPQALAMRYAGLMLIYVSSTADMFIAGLGANVLLPIGLAILSVAGVLLGMLLRVRAFLFLGVTFLFLVVFSQIWHQAVDRSQTWVWWASGIVLGVAILTLFALFEKRRNEVLKMIDDLKRWR